MGNIFFRRGQYVALAEKKNGKYIVSAEPATYQFKLTVYDKDYAARKDSDSLLVVIGGSGKKNNDKDDDKKIKSPIIGGKTLKKSKYFLYT